MNIENNARVDHSLSLLWEKKTGNAVNNALEAGDDVPAHLTLLRPTIFPAGDPRRSVWDAASGSWVAEPDFTRVSVFDKSTGLGIVVEAGQPLPEHATLAVPPRGERVAAQRDERARSWRTLPDWRGFSYKTADGSHIEINHIGIEPPAEHTAEVLLDRSLFSDSAPDHS